MSNRVMKAMTVFVTLAGAALTAGCASDDYDRYEERCKENLDLMSSNSELKTRLAKESSDKETIARQLRTTDAEKERLAQEAEERNSKQGGKTAGSGGPIDETALRGIVDDLRKELGKQAPEVNLTTEGNIEVTLQSDVTFGSGSSELSDSGKKSLKALSTLLNGRFAPYQVRIEGHTDATPLVRTKDKYKDNFGLGSARSLSVVRFLESEMAIQPTRLMSASRGEHDPIADEKTASGRKKNRRVDVVVVIPHDAAMSLAK